MKTFFTKSIALAIAVSVTSTMMAGAAPKPKPKPKHSAPAVMTVIHAIPATFGADKVDIYSNGMLLINDATPGASKSFSLEPGTQEISVFADGVVPSSTTAAILSFRPVYLAHGMDVTFVAHLNASEKPTLSFFKNKNTEPGKKRSWLTVRHIAAAPAVDVRTNSVSLFRSLTNGYERKISLRYGTYPVNVVLAGTATNALAPTSVEIKEKKNLVVYVWGAASKGNLQYLTQSISTK